MTGLFQKCLFGLRQWKIDDPLFVRPPSSPTQASSIDTLSYDCILFILFELLWLAFSPKNKIKYFISVVIVVVFCWTKYLLGDRKQTAGTVLFWSFHLSYFFSLSNDTWLENIRDQQLFTAPYLIHIVCLYTAHVITMQLRKKGTSADQK